MKNTLNTSNGIAILLSNVDDGTNTIVINGADLPPSQWVGEGNYTFTDSGVTFTIQKIVENSGNIMLQLVSGTTYRLVKNASYNIRDAYFTTDPAETDLADGDYVPFYDTSAGAKKKSLWSNIINKIKTAIWKSNTNAQEGYVASGSGQNNKAWRTDTSGNPAWRDYDNLHFATVTSLDADTVDEDGIWYVKGTITHAPISYHGLFMYVKSVGTPCQIYIPDATLDIYKRWYTSGAWTTWAKVSAGSAVDATKVNNWFSSRPTSANVQFGDGFLRHFKATNAMTTGKPTIGDAHIIDLAWDGNNGYDVQLAIGNSNSGIQYRSQLAGAWQDWLTLIHSGNIGSQTVKRAKELNYATDTTDLNSVNGNGWYSIAEAKNAIYSGQTYKALAINWYWGIDIRTRGIAYTQINGYQILTTENGVPKTGGTFTGAVNVKADLVVAKDSGASTISIGTTAMDGRLILANQSQTILRATQKSSSSTVYLPSSNGTIALTSSSRRIKENIRDITEEEAQKLLDIDVVKFDYKEGWGDGKKNHAGFIAEDVQKIIPETVIANKNYDPNLPIDVEYNFPPEMDYQKFIPYLVKMVQIQQQEINELKAAIKALTEG